MNSLFSKAIFAVVIMTNLSSFAQSVNTYSKAQGFRQSAAKGGVATGGGDLCEDRIQSIRADLRSWMNRGGHEALELPNGLTADRYSEDMIQSMALAKIRCVGEGDADYPVAVLGIAKVCLFEREGNQALITCDYRKFQSMTDSDQYRLIHHEYAGIADIETPTGADSNYEVSNQISKYLEIVNVRKLAVKIAENKFKSVPANKIETFKRSIPWKNLAYSNYEQSEGWDALEFIGGGFVSTPEEVIRSARSVKIKTDGERTTLLFERQDVDTFKTITIVTIERNAIKSMRSEFKALAATWPDPKHPKKSVEGWKTIAWEAYY